MENDNIYPNDGNAFSLIAEPKAQKAGRAKEKGKVLAALPMLEDVIKRFQMQIDFLDSLSSIPISTRADEKMILVNFHANDLSRRFLIDQKQWLEELIEDYTKPD